MGCCVEAEALPVGLLHGRGFAWGPIRQPSGMPRATRLTCSQPFPPPATYLIPARFAAASTLSVPSTFTLSTSWARRSECSTMPARWNTPATAGACPGGCISASRAASSEMSPHTTCHIASARNSERHSGGAPGARQGPTALLDQTIIIPAWECTRALLLIRLSTAQVQRSSDSAPPLRHQQLLPPPWVASVQGCARGCPPPPAAPPDAPRGTCTRASPVCHYRASQEGDTYTLYGIPKRMIAKGVQRTRIRTYCMAFHTG